MPQQYAYQYNRTHGIAPHTGPDEYDIGHEGENPTLQGRILAQWPAKTDCVVQCDSVVCTISFDTVLSEAEVTTLNGLVAAHKVAADWPQA